MLLEDNASSFNCHKTVYNLDLNMNEVEGYKQPLKMCYGAYKFLLDLDRPNIQMRLHKVLYGDD